VPERGVPERRPATPRRRSSPSWARLIAKIYQVDPVVCSRCGQRMSVIAFLWLRLPVKRCVDPAAVRRQREPRRVGL
jgi:hypothetical protein